MKLINYITTCTTNELYKSFVVVILPSPPNLWHEHLGHPSFNRLHMIPPLSTLTFTNFNKCYDVCDQAKYTHMDVKDPIELHSYLMHIIFFPLWMITRGALEFFFFINQMPTHISLNSTPWSRHILVTILNKLGVTML